MSAVIYFSAGLTAGQPIEVELYKNGALWKAISSLAPGTTAGLCITALDLANGTDFYEVYVYLTSASTGTVFGQANYTLFEGEQIWTQD